MCKYETTTGSSSPSLPEPDPSVVTSSDQCHIYSNVNVEMYTMVGIREFGGLFSEHGERLLWRVPDFPGDMGYARV